MHCFFLSFLKFCFVFGKGIVDEHVFMNLVSLNKSFLAFKKGPEFLSIYLSF